MKIGPTSQPDSIDDNANYTAEVRFGVVMYGGVSLAVYINGVTNELYEMVCATPRTPLPTPDAEGTREIYARLSWLVTNPSLRSAYAEKIDAAAPFAQRGRGHPDPWAQVVLTGAERSRLIVDVVSGTSAGGINGIFLAKALANGEQFQALQGLWLTEGDIGKLLNDSKSYKDLGDRAVDRSARPKSLLNSDRMYLKLLDALSAMKPVPAPAGMAPGPSPLVEQMDLFVTTTDILGAPVALRLFDKVVYERRYKQSFHFQYPGGVTVLADDASSGNDFCDEQIPFLAFAARCTSSFPFAFEPMTLMAMTKMRIGVDLPGLRRWDPFFAALPKDEVASGQHVYRSFGDGGYLDNKPFSYVVAALSQRFSTVPLERKLIYIEPSPERINPHARPGPTTQPDALSNALAALTAIPSYEGIREDLQDILKRNRRVERVEKIVRLGEQDLENQAEPFKKVLTSAGKIPLWTDMTLEDMERYYGLAFFPYRRLRLYAVTDHLADQLGQRWGVDPDSDHQYALRALVRVWRERGFDDRPMQNKPTDNAFLDQFDLDYRLRRLSFLLRKTDQVTRLFRERRAAAQGIAAGEMSEANESLLNTVKRHFEQRDPTVDPESADVAIAVLRLLKIGLLDARRQLVQVQRQMSLRPAQSVPAGLRGQLQAILALLLDEASAARGGDAAGPQANAASDTPSVRLDLVSGGTVPVALGGDGLRAASTSQTLQECVVARARALFDASTEARPTMLQAALEAAMESMRFKQEPGVTPRSDSAQAAAARAFLLLGKPELIAELTLGPLSIVIGVHVHVADRAEPQMPPEGLPLELLDSDVGNRLRHMFGEYYLRFDSFDQMSFPLYYDTGTGEPAIVDVIRISPVDATGLIDESDDSRRKLAGTALAHFGAFLDERWRRNDVMWGRLDGAERLISALLPASDKATLAVKQELVNAAHGRILRAALTGHGNLQLTGLLCDALNGVDGETVDQRLKQLVEQLGLGDSVQRERLAAILASLLDEAGLSRFVRTTLTYDKNPDPTATLRNLSRAVTVAGRVLDGISASSEIKTAMPRWLARGGLLLQGIVAVSLPGTFNQRWFSYGVSMLYAFEIVALLFALVFGSNSARSLAATALVVTVATHFLSLVAGDIMRERGRWKRLGAFGFIAAAGVLAVLGGLGLYHVGIAAQLCGPLPSPGSVDAAGTASWFCRWTGR